MAVTEASPRRKVLPIEKLTSSSPEGGQRKKSETSIPSTRLTIFEKPHVISLRVDTDEKDPRKISNQTCPDASCPPESCRVPVDPQ